MICLSVLIGIFISISFVLVNIVLLLVCCFLFKICILYFEWMNCCVNNWFIVFCLLIIIIGDNWGVE